MSFKPENDENISKKVMLSNYKLENDGNISLKVMAETVNHKNNTKGDG